MIEFDNIPASIRKPGKYLEFNTALAVRTLPANLQKMLIVAQRLAAGSVAALVPTRVFSDAEAAGYFGSGSDAHLMVRAAITANPYLDLSVCALDDAVAGVAAAGSELVSGPATGPGSYRLFIGGRKIEVGIANGATAASIAAALVAEAANYADLPAGLAVNGVTPEQIDITARHKGTTGNQISIAHEISAAGVAAVTVAMVGGATDPDTTTAFAVIFGAQYHFIAIPYTDQTAATALRDHLDAVSGPLEQRPGRGVAAMTGSLGAATTLAGQVNGGRVSLPHLRGTRSAAMVVAAAYAAVGAGEEDPARPWNTLALKGIHAPGISDRLSRTEQEAELANGVTPLEVGPGEKVQIVRAISTYTLDPQGIADISLLDFTTIGTLDYVRKACRDRVALRFPRSKLSARTPARVRTEILDVLDKLEELEIVEEVAANKDGVIVEKSLQDPNRLDSKIPVDIVNGLHVFAGRIDLLL
ncbi:Mu-like prophage tail sheath protein gpL [Desulfuromonas soudanensis]|uniref:Mu-like prophage tail sheath protein gpL n=1 Tax=Desulfuromonas soudanensis TaxID=1603606 RepID=A0A0M5IQV9_9BACT|nr:phage tail sheath subtilisin-like domain-containing protein [Desulfuromonas soudanensis]ALC15656.1 Mu-like prophage tail sheath protein gpL [Desulfuromonas soudanensis]